MHHESLSNQLLPVPYIYYIYILYIYIIYISGLSPQSPVAIATFGSLLVRRGDIKLGGWFTMVAKALSEKMGSKECSSKQISSFTNHLSSQILSLSLNRIFRTQAKCTLWFPKLNACEYMILLLSKFLLFIIVTTLTYISRLSLIKLTTFVSRK